jgi:hypothetical protein
MKLPLVILLILWYNYIDLYGLNEIVPIYSH